MILMSFLPFVGSLTSLKGRLTHEMGLFQDRQHYFTDITQVVVYANV